MSTDREGLTLRFEVGSYESSVIGLLLVLQFTLGAMLVVMTFGWVYFTLNAWSDPNRDATFLFGAIPVLVGMAAVVYLLGKLYE